MKFGNDEAMCAARFVVVSGPPASGKSTVAPPIAAALELPLIAKDVIKDALMSVIVATDVETSRTIGRAAVQAMLAVAATSPIGAVLESNFYRSRARDELARLPGNLVEVFCRCDERVASDRYQHRAGTRGAGHFDELRTRNELWNAEISEPVDGGWPLIMIDTNFPVDVSTVIAQIHTALDA